MFPRRSLFNLTLLSTLALSLLLVAACSSEATPTATPAEAETTATAVVAEAATAAATPEPQGSQGGGSISVGGVTYVFEAEFCANDEDGIFNEGNGVASDGTPFTGGIFAQPSDDGYVISVDLSLGQESIYGPPDFTQPRFSATSFGGFGLEGTVDGTRVSGSGEAIDETDNALAPGETIAISFDGQCGDS